MPPRAKKADTAPCEWIGQKEAFRRFATHSGGTEGSKHIKPLHWYIACRLVLEGGFDPDHITPRPPFVVLPQRHRGQKGMRFLLLHDSARAGFGEQVILGGLKTKNVDVVVTNPRLGPVLAVSCKGMTKAFRNLTNRMEETIGECTNLHITYPAMVIGYYALLRANRTVQDAIEVSESEEQAPDDDEAADDPTLPSPVIEPPSGQTEIIKANDIAIHAGPDGEVATDSIIRFERALSEMTLRQGIRDEISRYESMAIALVEPKGSEVGNVFQGFPAHDSPLHHAEFFRTLYRRYEERFVYGAPLFAERGITTRFEWAPESPALNVMEFEFVPRIAGS
jgi:hypothetical protein